MNAMAISTEIVGKEFGPFVRSYDFRDLEICALGCNAGYDGITDLEYLNEGDANDPPSGGLAHLRRAAHSERRDDAYARL